MIFLDLLANGNLTRLLADLAGQLLAVSITGIVIVKLLSGKPAPVRSLAAAGALASMLCLFVLSAAFHASDIAWYKADISRFSPKPAALPAIPAKPAPMTEAVIPAMPENVPPLPDIGMENAVTAKPALTAAIKTAPAKTFQVKAMHCINALGILWAGGIIFMLLKLGYGLAFIRGFRFGLNRILDAGTASLLKTTAAAFNKQRVPELYTSPKVESPVTIGLFSPIVIIPEKLFATLSENELKSILLHELAHIYHYDHVIGVLKRIAIAANWWNPLAYVISAKHAVAREEVADNYVLRELAPKVYSECLAGLAEKICLISSYPAAAGMAGNYSSLEQRVRSILSKKRKLTMTTSISFKFITVTVCGALALFAAGVQGCISEPEPELTPEKIIAGMAETYAKCKSYQDTGTVKIVTFQNNGESIREQPFATSFIRPDQFRFEYKEKVDSFLKEKPCYIVWRKGDEVLTWFFARPDITKVQSLSSGIAGATGVSSGSAHTIPALLLPEVGGRKLSDIKEAKLLEDGIFDNVNCFRIQGKFVISHDNGKVVRKPTVIWIDKKTFLVRRIDEETVFNYFRNEETTTYYPVINSDIPGKMLDFDPPGGNEMLNRIKPAEKAPDLSLDSVKGNSPPDEKESRRLYMIGHSLSAKQAAELEQKLSKNPDDISTIVLLLSYWDSIYRGDNAARQKREKYILWLIEHHPEVSIAGASWVDGKSKEMADAVKKLWLEQTGKNPKNPQIFWNAANCMSDIDKALSEQLLVKGQSLDPENPKWAERLGNLYFWGNQPEKALNEYKKVYSKTTDTMNKVYAISRMAKSAVDCGKLQEAGEYAQEMQRLAKTYGNKDENYGKLFFNSNLVLGRIALKQGRADEAGKYLLEAGKTPVSLKDMPDFTLVKDLLAAGKKDIVLQFFQSCAQFWDKTLCDEWVKQINDGKTPDFKYNPWANVKVKEVKKDAAKPEAATKPDSETKAAGYQLSGTIPADFEPRGNARGEAVFSESKGFPPVARMEVQADANGEFHVSFPATASAQTVLRVKIRFLSEVYAPLEAVIRVTPGKPVTVTFPKLLKKRDAVHYSGVLLDEVTNEPVPYTGIYADGNGTEIGRADEKGRFDLYVEPWGGTTHILPYLSSDQYAGHSYFFKHNRGESVELKLIMERGVRVRVHTEDGNGVAVPGVYLRWMGGGGAAGTTDKNGDALLSGMLSRVRPGQLTEVRKEGYELAQDPGPLNAILFTDKPLRVVMRRIAGSSASEAVPAQKNNSDSAGGDSKNAATLSPQEKAQKRMLEDSKIYSKDELKSIEELYGAINAENLQKLLAKYRKANRTGCALLYMGQLSKGDEQIKYLQQAIDDFSDCADNVYGVQVGAYARYLLACIYSKNGEKAKAAKLIEEIKTDFPDSVDYYGKSLVATIMTDSQRNKAWSRMAEDSKIYSQDELKKIEEFYQAASNKLATEEAKEKLKTLIAQYKKSNRAGCALLYLGQFSKGDERIKYLEQAIDNSSDCFYGDGAQVGAYARLLLARIYLKNGENAKAAKLIEEIKTCYPDAIDHAGDNIVLIMALTALGEQTPAGTKIRNIGGYWNKFKWWQALHQLQETTGVVSREEQEAVDALGQELTANVYLVKFKPVNGFDPATPQELLASFRKCSSLESQYMPARDKVGGASAFKTANVNNQLVGAFLTEDLQQMKANIEQNSSLQFLSGEKVTPEMVVKHTESEQEYLMDKWKTRGPQIIETIPANNAKDVDPGLTQITVKFDRKMGNRSWSVCTVYPGGDETQFPINGKLHYDDSCTVFTIPVKLQPGHTYKTSLNAKKFIGFVSADGIPLYPYPYTFTTGDKKSESAKSETIGPAAQADAAKTPETSGAGGNELMINMATTAAEKWLALVDDGKYPESWTAAAAYFKNAVTASAWEQAVKAVRGPLGKLLSRKVKNAAYHTSLPGAPDGRYVVIQFETSFENKQSAVETVTPMADPDGQWRVSGYYIK